MWSIILFLVITLPIKDVCPMFEYICKEEQLFKPYLHIYQGIRGDRLRIEGPGFHDVFAMKQNNLYVCINGPAYLYYEKTTALGTVYEAPQFKVFSHTCEMHNVKPHLFATHIDFELHLRAVLLLGVEEDYRRSFIQRFTAPYFFAQDQYRVGFEPHYQNATSIALIGRMPCTIEKGNKDPLSPVTLLPPSNQVAYKEGPTLPDTTLPENDELICRLGFSELLSKVKTPAPTPPSKEQEQMWAMVNDEPFQPEKDHCEDIYDVVKTKEMFDLIDTDSTDPNTGEVKKSLKTRASEITVKITAKDTWKKEFEDKVKPITEILPKQITDLEKTIADLKTANPNNPLIPRHEKKLQKMQDKLKGEEDKKKAFDELVDKLNPVPAPPTTADTDKARDAVEALKTERDKLPPLKEIKAIDEQKVAIYNAKINAHKEVLEVSTKISTFKAELSTAEILVEQIEHELLKYRPGTPTSKSSRKKLTYQVRSKPVTIEITVPDIANPSPICDKLPALKAECENGKPDATESCEFFKIAMGKSESLWLDPNAEDYWKKDILTMVSDIFVNACPYLANRRKFVRLINDFMGYYITSPKHFNQPATAGTSMSCEHFRQWKIDQFTSPHTLTTPSPNDPPPKENKEERPFWTTLREILIECKKEERRLIFKDFSYNYGTWKWVSPNATTESDKYIEIFPYREQAEEEFVFNWVIDMSWRIFSTTLGICMPGYETKNPLISSRFHSLFTEDFLIPLRETWINAKDNLIFQWILGEFYNGEAEQWAELCMEASYLYAKRETYRPLRTLLVNCAVENNYFTNGILKGAGSPFPD